MHTISTKYLLARLGLAVVVLGSMLCLAHSLEISKDQVNEAANKAMENLRKRREAAIQMMKNQTHAAGHSMQLTSGCPFASARHSASRSAKIPRGVRDMTALFEETTKELVKRFAIEDYNDVQKVSLEGTVLEHAQSQCRRRDQISCNPYDKYRSADGSCNNLRNPHWGRAGTCMKRMLSPAYADGVSVPRGRGNLPNPRSISTTVHMEVDRPAVFTHMVMQFGQFLDHDFALAPIEEPPEEIVNLGNPNNPVDCCSPGRRNAPECFSFDIPRDDTFFRAHGQTCMNVPRSQPCPFCETGSREQFDVLTSYIDGSQIYGSIEEDARRLRAFIRGLLKFQVADGKTLLPRSFHPNDDRCSDPQNGQFCFRAGDERVNEHPGLTAMHTVWLRQHNLIAKELRNINPRWSDYKLYQESRRIVVAQFQHIVYSEFVPLLVGPQISREDFDLRPRSQGYTFYLPNEDATMMNEFASAAYRVGHTLIQGTFEEVHRDGRTSTFNLQDFFFFPFDFYEGALDRILRGLLKQPAQSFDRFVTQDVTNHLYRLRNESFGLDLISLNIQRGRDHGLRPYIDYVKFCINVDIRDFSDLQSLMSEDSWRSLQRTYRNVAEIDLFPAGISEYPVEGGIVGPTFGCIFGNMFEKLRFGDRFYYEHAYQAGSFTERQLQEIRKTTFSRIICDNSDSIDRIQRNAFLPVSGRNPEAGCTTIPQTDLRYWRGEQ